MNIQSAQQARETVIFVIENGKVVETTLYDHVTASAEKTTSPRGVMTKLFFEEGVTCNYNEETERDEEIATWSLMIWQANGRAKTLNIFVTKEEAEDEWFTRTYNHDFLPDDQRDTSYYSTAEEAEAALAERAK
jgi:hypothetical protein